MREAILRTLAYFAVFHYPLTAEELHRFLWKEKISSYIQFLHNLDAMVQANEIQENNGFYFLPGEGQTVAVRQEAIRHVDRKLSLAKRAGRIVRCIPFVEAFFVCNTVASGTAKKDSDIDVFIVIRQGRLWLTRLLITGILALFRLRRTGTRIADRICLSFYATDNALNFSPLLLSNEDPYFTYWIHQLIPIFDPKHIDITIFEKNQWTAVFLPQTGREQISAPNIAAKETRWSKLCQSIGETLWGSAYGDIIERQAKILQTKKMEKNRHSSKVDAGTNVVVSDTVLKFHEKDRREEFRAVWRKRCEGLGFRV